MSLEALGLAAVIGILAFVVMHCTRGTPQLCRLDQDLLDQVHVHMNNSLGSKRIARLMVLPESTIREAMRQLREQGVVSCGYSGKRNKELTILKMHDHGMSVEEIVEAGAFKKDSVLYFLRKNGRLA